MPRITDKTTGSGSNPIYFPFAGRRRALFFVAFVDSEQEISEGYLTAAQGKLRGSLQDDNLNVADARFCCALDAGADENALVALSVNVVNGVSNETTGAGSNPTYFPFAGRRRALFFVAFVDSEQGFSGGFLTEVQDKLLGSLQDDKLNVADARFCCALDAGADENALVALRVNVARDVSDETTE